MVILIILLIIVIFYALFQKLQVYALSHWIVEKEYTPPSEDEMKKCIRFVLDNTFKS